MKKSLLGLATIGALIAGPAMAADMPLKAPPAPVAPAFSWTGCYIGVEGGGAWGHESVVATTGTPGATVTNINPSGGLIGGTIGCNYQFNNIVVGVEDDLSWDGLSGTGGDQAPFFNTTFSHSVKTTWLDTLRGRIGIVLPPPSTLLYVTGGAAWTNIQDSAVGPGVPAVSQTTTPTGWTVGGGVEHMFVGTHWSAKIEYLFVQFPTVSDPFNTFAPVGTYVGVNTKLDENILRVGLNWHF